MSAEIDFNLVWPDTEDLYETLMSSESAYMWQAPVTVGNLSSQTGGGGYDSMTPSSDELSKLNVIPPGESQQAVRNVSAMVTSLVRAHTLRMEFK